MQRCLALAAILFCILPGHARAMDRARFLELNKKGRELAQKKDWQGLRDILTEIGRELPGPSPTYLLRVASTETHLGHNALALEWLQRYAAMGLTYDVASDDDLKPLLTDPGFAKIAARMKENARAIQQPEQVCALPISDLMPEDITFHRASGDFIVSSIRRHGLFRLSLPKDTSKDKVCSLTELPLEDQARRWPVLAVSSDTRSDAVWISSAAMSGFHGFAKEDDGKSALLQIDVATGKVLHRFDLESSGPAVLGDMSVGPDGTAWVTDSRGGGIYSLKPKAGARLDPIATGLYSPQTLVVTRDGKRLLVPEYPIGIAIIDLTGKNDLAGPKTGKATYLDHPDNVAMTGLDGLLLSGDSLIGIQNGTTPERIIRYRLNHEQTRVLSSEVIEQSSGRLGEPTHATSNGDWIYVIANVGWDKIDDSGELKKGESFTPPVVLRFRK
jgi:hypothetical protein